MYAVSASGSGARIWKIAGGVASPFVGGAPVSTAAVDGVGAAAGFRTIGALASDSAGNVYAADTGTVRKISADGTVSSLAGAYAAGTNVTPPPPDVTDGSRGGGALFRAQARSLRTPRAISLRLKRTGLPHIVIHNSLIS